MLTKEEIERIREEDPALADKMEWVNKKLEANAALEGELTTFFTKVSSDPKRRKKMEELLSETGVDFKMPPSPAVEYTDKRVEELNEKLRMMEEEKIRSRLNETLERYNVSPEEYDELIKFQKEYSISDGFKAIELYAKERDKRVELEPTGAISLGVKPGEWNRDEAYRKTLDEIGKISLRR